MNKNTFFWKCCALAYMEGLKITGQNPILEGPFNFFKFGYRWKVKL